MTDEIMTGYTRVSDILRPWANFDKIRPEVLENKRQIGSNVHEAINEFNESLPISLDIEEEGYFASFQKWMDLTGAVIMFTEKRFYCDDLMITGCIDAVIRFPNEGECIAVDWKTCASCTQAMSRSWMHQGAFYHYLMEANGVPDLGERFLFVQLDKHGEIPRVKEYTYTTELMNDCAILLEAYRIMNPL